jgi:hypothetical protein
MVSRKSVSVIELLYLFVLELKLGLHHIPIGRLLVVPRTEQTVFAKNVKSMVKVDIVAYRTATQQTTWNQIGPIFNGSVQKINNFALPFAYKYGCLMKTGE